METHLTNCGRFAAMLQPFVDRHELAGAVLLTADAEHVLSLDTVGYANIAAQKPMQPDTLFWIASQTKPMTATALMMLVEDGLVRLDDPVEAYLPEFTGQWLLAEADETHQLLTKPAHPITVHNILTHTSGLPFQSAMETPTLDGLPLRDAVRSYAMTPLQFPPDSAYQYSNAGINTAGRIIEVVSGMAYEDFLSTRLLQPLGMTDTTFWPNAAQVTRLATSYTPNADKTTLEETPISQLHYPLDDPHRYPMPAGGLFSTAGDVVRFCQMILQGGVYGGRRYLSETSVRQMTSKQTGSDIADGYGYGWGTGNGTCEHGGAHATNMAIDMTHGLITIFLVQHTGFPGDGSSCQGIFRQAAIKAFATSR
ncbi:MAG TPA: serine hydrolase domain-containing protein [Armatimonadota bacterium]|nr:serine hydrolase domain-containing protein [Armatimonadota bacterium]